MIIRKLRKLFLSSCFLFVVLTITTSHNSLAMSSGKTKDGGTSSTNLANAVGEAFTSILSGASSGSVGDVIPSAQKSAEELNKTAIDTINSQGAGSVLASADQAYLQSLLTPGTSDHEVTNKTTNGSSTTYSCNNGLEWTYSPPKGGGSKPRPTTAPPPPTTAPTTAPPPPTSAPTTAPPPPTAAPTTAPPPAPCTPTCDCYGRCQSYSCTDCSGTCHGNVSAQGGACGSADGQSTCPQPTSNLCGGGSTPSSVTLNGTNNAWTWTCSGVCGGTTASCSAKKECSWIESNN